MSNLTSLKALVETFPRAVDGRIQYTNAFRKAVCELATKRVHTQKHIQEYLGINSSAISQWKQAYKANKYDATGISVSRMQPKNTLKELQAQLKEIETRKAKLETTIELLKEFDL